MVNPNTPSDDENAYVETTSRRPKRRKINAGQAAVARHRATPSLSELLDVFRHGLIIHQSPETEGDNANANKHEIECQRGDVGFESTMQELLAKCLQARQASWAQSSSTALPGDNKGVGRKEGESELLRPLTRFEIARIVALAKQRFAGHAGFPSEWVVLRKLLVDQASITEMGATLINDLPFFRKERRRAGIRGPPSLDIGTPATLTPLDVPSSVPAPQAVLDALGVIHTTQYEHSFAARVYGHTSLNTHGLIAVDWESRAPWSLLMDDVHAHYALAHPEREQPERPRTPITYVSLQSSHLRQVHELLVRIFWDGINVSDALYYTPERCTVIATYGHLVVGAAFLSSPQETYITYLVVRAGWENAQIATTMLYYLISLHPHRDITLHVSANNSAMLLYNRFGFKAEEFIAGFYDAYLDKQSRASKNAFLLRLRR